MEKIFDEFLEIYNSLVGSKNIREDIIAFAKPENKFEELEIKESCRNSDTFYKSFYIVLNKNSKKFFLEKIQVELNSHNNINFTFYFLISNLDLSYEETNELKIIFFKNLSGNSENNFFEEISQDFSNHLFHSNIKNEQDLKFIKNSYLYNENSPTLYIEDYLYYKNSTKFINFVEELDYSFLYFITDDYCDKYFWSNLSEFENRLNNNSKEKKDKEFNKKISIIISKLKEEHFDISKKEILKNILKSNWEEFGLNLFKNLYENNYRIDEKTNYNSLVSELILEFQKNNENFSIIFKTIDDLISYSVFILNSNNINKKGVLYIDNFIYPKIFEIVESNMEKFELNKIESKLFFSSWKLNNRIENLITLKILSISIFSYNNHVGRWNTLFKQILVNLKYSLPSNRFFVFDKILELLIIHFVLVGEAEHDQTTIKNIKNSLEIFEQIILIDFLSYFLLYRDLWDKKRIMETPTLDTDEGKKMLLSLVDIAREKELFQNFIKTWDNIVTNK